MTAAFRPCACCAPEFERIAQRLRELEQGLLPSTPAAPRRVVHILAHGRALCGLEGAPSDWAPGNLWVSNFDERERKLADCLACVRAAR